MRRENVIVEWLCFRWKHYGHLDHHAAAAHSRRAQRRSATYEPSIADLAIGNVTLTLTSTGPCTP
jgi:hypothetical protein